MVSGNSPELPIDVRNPAPAVFPARGIADHLTPSSDLRAPGLLHHSMREILLRGVDLAKDDVADTNIGIIADRVVLAYVAAFDHRRDRREAAASGLESNRTA